MTRDDIIRMAAKSGMHFYQFGWTTGDDKENLYPECVYTENLERFADLVAAAEREACAKLCEDLWSKGGWDYNAGYAADKILARGKA
jgi:hypothetical protein